MKYIDILVAFETEINKINDTVNKPATDDSLFWLNQAVAKFIKQRFNGDPLHKLGYEQTEKRREDLIYLFKQLTFSGNDIKYSNKFWSKYNGIISNISDSFNNSYLKSNGIEEGTENYSKIVNLLLIYYKLYGYN